MRSETSVERRIVNLLARSRKNGKSRIQPELAWQGSIFAGDVARASLTLPSPLPSPGSRAPGARLIVEEVGRPKVRSSDRGWIDSFEKCKKEVLGTKFRFVNCAIWLRFQPVRFKQVQKQGVSVATQRLLFYPRYKQGEEKLVESYLHRHKQRRLFVIGR